MEHSDELDSVEAACLGDLAIGRLRALGEEDASSALELRPGHSRAAPGTSGYLWVPLGTSEGPLGTASDLEREEEGAHGFQLTTSS